jgi:adenylate cyclase
MDRATTTLAQFVEPAERLRMHGLALVAPLFLGVYGKLVCPFIDSVSLALLSSGLAAVTVFHVGLREALYRLVPYRGDRSPARFGFRLSAISWLAAGVFSMIVHALLYPQFPWASHLKLVSGYWALGAGMLAQLEYGALERLVRRHGIAVPPDRERMARQLFEKFLVFTGVPALTVTMMVVRYIEEGFIGVGVGVEVVFLLLLFVLAAQAAAWNYGTVLREDTRGIVAGLERIADGRFDVRLDASRSDELGRVAEGINTMAEGLRLRERIREAFGRFVSPEVAESVIRDHATGDKDIALGGERRELTILMADLRDFTPMSESLAPEVLTDTLNAYFTEMVAAVGAHGGMVDKFMGDAVMAVFGLVPERGCSAGRAVDAARDMLTRLDVLNAERAGRGEPPLRMGIGIHLGEVVAGYLGSKDRLEFTVIGQPVNLAQRIQSEARGDLPPLLFSEAVAKRLAGAVPSRLVTTAHLKGVESPLDLYSVDHLATA